MRNDTTSSYLKLVSNQDRDQLKEQPSAPETANLITKTASLAKSASRRTREVIFFSPWKQRSKMRI